MPATPRPARRSAAWGSKAGCCSPATSRGPVPPAVRRPAPRKDEGCGMKKLNHRGTEDTEKTRREKGKKGNLSGHSGSFLPPCSSSLCLCVSVVQLLSSSFGDAGVVGRG